MNGVNNEAMAPTITAAAGPGHGTMTQVNVNLPATVPAGSILDFFASEPDDPQQSYNQAQIFLYEYAVQPGDPGTTLMLPIPTTLADNQYVTDTLTLPSSDTSEFATPSPVSNSLSVTTTVGFGAGSLPYAISTVDTDHTDSMFRPDTITFAIPTTDPGYSSTSDSWIISLSSALPAITNPVILDGTTQPGYSGSPIIEIDGNNQPIDGFQLGTNSMLGTTSAGSTIEGLDIVNVSGPAIDVETNDNKIQKNDLGVETDGSTAAPNRQGVLINGSNNTIGASASAGNVIVSNVIANNTGDAVDVNSGTGNEIQGNLIYSNGSSISNAVSNEYPSPTLSNPTSNAGAISVTVSVSSSEVGSALTLDFYTDASGEEPARFYLGSVPVTVTTTSFSVTLTGSVSNGQSLIATATEPEVNPPEGQAPPIGTSMFSDAVKIKITSNFQVINTNASGDGSLEAAILKVDSEPPLRGTTDVITFDITTGTAPYVILQTTPLGAITVPVTIDGLSQIPGFSVSPVIEIANAGTPPGSDGLILGPGSDGSTITGLEIVEFSGAGIHVESSGDTIIDNWIGTDDTTEDNTLGDQVGIFVDGTNGGVAAMIGGTASGAANIIGFNQSAGVSISGSSATGNVVAGNFIGTDARGRNLGNLLEGVVIADAPGNTIGGTVAGAGNTIAFNIGSGVSITGSSALSNLVADNSISGNATGSRLTAVPAASRPGATSWRPTSSAPTAKASISTAVARITRSAGRSLARGIRFRGTPAPYTSPPARATPSART